MSACSEDVAVQVTVRGSGRPLVVLHGWRLDSTVEQADLEPVFDDNPGWRRYYVDLPGMGESPPLGPDATLATYVDAVEGEISALVGSTRYALAGTSAGALIARHIASRHRNLVAGLLLRMPLTEPDDRRRDVPTGAGAELLARDASARAAKIEAVWRPAEQRVHDAARALRADHARYRLGVPDDVLEVPGLIVAGRQDTRAGWHGAVALAEGLPRATLAVIAGAEHEYPWGRDTVFEALVARWLRDTEDHVPLP